MNILSLKKILCLLLIVCHALSDARPTPHYNRVVNIGGQFGSSHPENIMQFNHTSPDDAPGLTSRPWFVPTVIASVVLLGVCIYAYCKHRRHQMVVHPVDVDRDDHDDGGEDGGGGGGDRFVYIPQFWERIPRLNSLPHDHPERIFEAPSFGALPQPLQNELRALRQLPIPHAEDVMPPVHTDERDFALFFNALENYAQYREILMFDAADRRISLGHITDAYDIYIRHINGEIRPFNYLPLNEQRVHLVSMRFINDVFQRTNNRLNIPSNERALETYILVQRGLARLPEDIVININELAFANANFGLLTLLDRVDFSIAEFRRIFSLNDHPIDFSRFRFYR